MGTTKNAHKDPYFNYMRGLDNHGHHRSQVMDSQHSSLPALNKPSVMLSNPSSLSKNLPLVSEIYGGESLEYQKAKYRQIHRLDTYGDDEVRANLKNLNARKHKNISQLVEVYSNNNLLKRPAPRAMSTLD